MPLDPAISIRFLETTTQCSACDDHVSVGPVGWHQTEGALCDACLVDQHHHLGMVVILANLLRQIGAFCPTHHLEQQEALASIAGIAQLYDRTESMAWQRRELDFVREMGRLMEALQEPEQLQ